MADRPDPREDLALLDDRAGRLLRFGDLAEIDFDAGTVRVLRGAPGDAADLFWQEFGHRLLVRADDSKVPQYIHVALANATRAIAEHDDAALGTVNEVIQPLVDSAMVRIRELEAEVVKVRKESVEANEHAAYLEQQMGHAHE